MQKGFTLLFLLSLVVVAVSFTNLNSGAGKLRKMYSRPPDEWPAPTVDPGIAWKELGVLPTSHVFQYKDSFRHLVELGKVLFFDARLSSSGKISCSSCHQPELSWTDGKTKSEGHEGTKNKRNSPTILNVWFYEKLFWDGRSTSLEDQAFSPINSESEMHSDMRMLPGQLRRIKGYLPLFDSAFGDPAIDPDRITKALAVFQRSIVSQPSRFDKFLSGDKKALSKKEIKGLHLFRTKARCMNCHHGPMFTDNSFHHNGFALSEEKGLYNVTHKDEDMGRFKTPSLRDVAFTGPYMESGQIKDLHTVISMYSDQKFPGSPAHDKAIQSLGLSFKEKEAVLAFLKAISEAAPVFKRPEMPE